MLRGLLSVVFADTIDSASIVDQYSGFEYELCLIISIAFKLGILAGNNCLILSLPQISRVFETIDNYDFNLEYNSDYYIDKQLVTNN